LPHQKQIAQNVNGNLWVDQKGNAGMDAEQMRTEFEAAETALAIAYCSTIDIRQGWHGSSQ
jgi:hypothetical protein